MHLSKVPISYQVHHFKFTLYGIKFHQCALELPTGQKCSVGLTIKIFCKK